MLSKRIIGILMFGFLSLSGSVFAAEDVCIRSVAILPDHAEAPIVDRHGQLFWYLEQKNRLCQDEGICDPWEASGSYLELLVAQNGRRVRFPFSEFKIISETEGANGVRVRFYDSDAHLEVALKTESGTDPAVSKILGTVIHHRGLVRAGDESRGNTVLVGGLDQKLLDSYTYRIPAGSSADSYREYQLNAWKVALDSKAKSKTQPNLSTACLHFEPVSN